MPTQGEQAAMGFADAITSGDRYSAIEVCHPIRRTPFGIWVSRTGSEKIRGLFRVLPR